MKRLIKISYLRLVRLIRQPVVKLAFGLTVIVVLISTGFLSINLVGKTYQYSIGDIATEDIRVSRDIQYNITSETARKKEQASIMTPLVFDRDQLVLMERLRMMDLLFRYISDTMKENPPLGTDDRTFQLYALKAKIPEYLNYGDRVLLGILRSDNPEKVRTAVSKILIFVYDRGILDKPYDNPLKIENQNVTIRTINDTGESTEETRTLAELVTLDDVKRDIGARAAAIARDLPQDERRAVQDVVWANLRTNLSFNADETRRRIDESVKSVKPVMGTLKRGQTLVREGDTITTEAVEKINIVNTHTAARNINYILGILLIQLMFLMIFGYLILFSYESILPDRKSAIMIFSLIVIFIVYTFFVTRATGDGHGKLIIALLLPISFITMMIAILNSLYIAMIVGLYVIFFAFAISGESSTTLIISFSSAFMGAFMARDVDKRSGFLRTGLVIGLVNAIIVIAFWLMGEFVFTDMISNLQLAIANGLICSILVLGFFPLYEALFGVTTNFKLLELSDLNAPIFKKMLIKAPGTYNHSLMVGNMAEAACQDIGANHLLARVGGYYHDIGKIPDSGMYIENKITDPRAKTMTPTEYAKLIISHVQKGAEKAVRDNLPQSVITFIQEHHGRSTMTYFYHQALERAESQKEAEEIKKSDFQYPGPSPHSREAAIVMLADAVEAASRSINEPTYEKLEGLVKKITYNKLNEGELEDSNLTMSDLNRVQKAFLRILFGMFHTRIEYPSKQDVEDLEDRLGLHEDAD